MKFLNKIIPYLFLSSISFAQSQNVQDDITKLLNTNDVRFIWTLAEENTAQLVCRKDGITVDIKSSEAEADATAYYLLRKLGFLFPHPRMEIKPSAEQIKKQCGLKVTWTPRLVHRGFHVHTQHPSEWVAGYFMGYDQIAQDTNRWLARNQQNYLQIQVIQLNEAENMNLLRVVQNAKAWGLNVGLSTSFGHIQQRSRHMIAYWNIITGNGTLENLEQSILKHINKFPIDFMTFELGTSEFTPTSPETTIEWMNKAAQVLKANNKGMYIKVHVSNNQHDPKYGNFNFLPQYTDPHVGVLPHTVFFYGLNETYAPFYHRINYDDMKQFILDQSAKRPYFYHPETSYFIYMDIDAPLLLTDYLKIRTEDVDWMEEHKLDKIMNFSTGQEVGYWLFDYQAALLSDPASRKNPTYALELIGEDKDSWQKIIAWQNKYIKELQLIQVLFFSNLLDEVPFLEPVHEQVTVNKISSHVEKTKAQLSLLEEALKNKPDFSKVKNEELKLMLEVTLLRAEHAFAIRTAALNFENKNLLTKHLEDAKTIRLSAQAKMEEVFTKYYRYPEVTGLYEKNWNNPTSYGFGYLYTSRSLYLWEREEDIVKNKIMNPFYKSLVNPLRILLPREIFNFFNWF